MYPKTIFSTYFDLCPKYHMAKREIKTENSRKFPVEDSQKPSSPIPVDCGMEPGGNSRGEPTTHIMR
jgi:hypothetical protein